MRSLTSLIGLGLLIFLNAPALASPFTFNGSAVPGPNGIFKLTPSAVGQTGSVWTTTKRQINLGFRTSFLFRITNPGGIEGADGFAFVIQNVGNTALGVGGGGIGYHGIPRSIAIEFDTYQNVWGVASDPDNNHIGIHTNGINPNDGDESFSLGTTSLIPNLSDGNVHAVKIGYYSGILTVAIDGVIVLTRVMSLVDALDPQGKTYFGFTSATGAGFETHEVGGWCLVLL